MQQIKLLEEYRTFQKQSVKIIPRKVKQNQKQITIPDNKLKNVGLNGSTVMLTTESDEVLEFIEIDTQVKFRQYLDGKIAKEGEKLVDSDYFVIEGFVKKFGTNILNDNSDGYIFVKYDNDSRGYSSNFLIDSDGELVDITNAQGDAIGNLEVEITNGWLYGDLKLTWDSKSIQSKVQHWIVADSSAIRALRVQPWALSANESFQDYLDKSLEVIPAPRIGMPTFASGYTDENENFVPKDRWNFHARHFCKTDVIVNSSIWGTQDVPTKSIKDLSSDALITFANAENLSDWANELIPLGFYSRQQIVSDGTGGDEDIGSVSAITSALLGRVATEDEIAIYAGQTVEDVVDDYLRKEFVLSGKFIQKHYFEITLDFVPRKADPVLFKGMWVPAKP